MKPFYILKNCEKCYFAIKTTSEALVLCCYCNGNKNPIISIIGENLVRTTLTYLYLFHY